MVRILQEETIWFPGVYAGRQGDYAKQARDVPIEQLIELVQTRAKEDGEWAIANGFVGENEANMRKMIEFVSDEKNIRQCVDYVLKEKTGVDITVDWVCRDLANASKWAHGSQG